MKGNRLLHYQYVTVLLLLSLSLLLFASWNKNNSLLPMVAAEKDEEDGAATPQCDENDKTCDATASLQDATVFAALGEPSEYTTSSTGVKLAIRKWIPANKDSIQAVIVFHHGGIGFHSGYTKSAGEFFKAKNIAYISYDAVGNGYSDSIDGHRAYFDTVDHLSNDFTKIVQDAKAQFPGKKVMAMGESFGCFVLLNQVLLEQKKKKPESSSSLADGYVLIGPVVKVLPEMWPPTFVITILKFLANFFPMLTMPGTDFTSTFDLAFGDKRWAKASWPDPFIQEFVKTPPRLGMAASVLGAIAYVNDHLEDIDVPFKIFLGEHEGRVDVDAIHKLAEKAKSKDKALEVVPEGYHQLFQDMPVVTRNVCEGITKWVLARS